MIFLPRFWHVICEENGCGSRKHLSITPAFPGVGCVLCSPPQSAELATLPLWFEPKHNYLGPAVTEWIYEPVGLICAGFSAVGLFLGWKSKISYEQNVKEFQFYICMSNFRPLDSIIKKKYRKVADPLNNHIYQPEYKNHWDF